MEHTQSLYTVWDGLNVHCDGKFIDSKFKLKTILTEVNTKFCIQPIFNLTTSHNYRIT